MPKRRPDEGHRLTDQELAKLERRIAKLYKQAADEVQDTITQYFESFKARDEEMKKLVGTEINGKVWTETDYKLWRLAQIGRGKRFEALRDKLAERYTNANATAIAYTNDATPGIYSLNRNYAAYTIEQVAGDVDFTLWDEQTVKRLIVEEPELMPYYPKKRALKRGIDLAWGKKQITASVNSAILQGKSIKGIADDLQRRIETMNRDSAIRTARTAITGAQNAGRMDSYKAAEKMGIEMEREWVATLDGRTRHDHAMADGQVVGVDEPFTVGGHKIMFPGDPKGRPEQVYSCRCTQAARVKGVDTSDAKRRAIDPETGESVLIDKMTYTEWQKWMQKRQYGDIIGKETSTGIEIKSISAHTVDRATERGVSQKSVLDAINNPMQVGEVIVDEKGRKSQRFIGREATVNINPDTGNIVTTWKTGKATRRKYEEKTETKLKKPEKNSTEKTARTSYTMKELNEMNRDKLERIGREVARKTANESEITEEEAIRRFEALVKHNTTTQLRKYINRHGK